MAEAKPGSVKILFFIDSLQAGGKERRLTELMKELKKDSPIEFELVLMNREIYYKQVLDLKIRIHYLIRKTKKDLSIFRQFYAIGKSFRPDIIHCWDSMTAIYAIPTCKLLNIKLVNGLVVDTPVKGIHNKYRSRAKLTFPFSNLIIGNSKAGLSAYNAPAGKSACVYNGMDLNRFENLEDPLSVLKKIFNNEYQGLFIVGMVAAFEDRKDYRTLIKTAIRMVKEHENIRFIMVGDGSNLNELKKTIPLLLTDKIIFLGKRSDVESIVNVFDVGILLTNSKVHGEGISNSLIEYLALGKAAIATRGGGTDEVIVDNENGYLIDPENEDQLVNKIEIIMQNQELKKRLGDFGYKFAREKFDLKIMSDNYITIYKTLINKK